MRYKTIIQTPARNLQKSKTFYEKIGFAVKETEDACFASDGVSILKLNTDAYARPGILCYLENWQEIFESLMKLTPVIETKDDLQFTDLSGTIICLKKKPLPNVDFEDVIETSVLGNNSGVSIETPSIDKSMSVWELLGFTLIQGSVDAGWVTLQNTAGVNVSLMALNTCPHLFLNPSLTFFNGKSNKGIISKLHELAIDIEEEIVLFNKKCEVDNVVLRDPGGVGFFVFND